MNQLALPVSFVSRGVLSLAVAFGFVASSAFAAPDGNGLAENSPFLPQGYQRPQDQRQPPREPPPPPSRGPQPLDQIEFRGLTTFGGETSFSLFDPNEQESYWIPLGRTDGGFTIVEFKDGEEAVVVRHEGKTRTISLHESKVAALPPEATPSPRDRRQRNQQQEQEAEDPEERMKRLAEEIRRRREMRREALEEAQNNN